MLFLAASGLTRKFVQLMASSPPIFALKEKMNSLKTVENQLQMAKMSELVLSYDYDDAYFTARTKALGIVCKRSQFVDFNV